MQTLGAVWPSAGRDSSKQALRHRHAGPLPQYTAQRLQDAPASFEHTLWMLRRVRSDLVQTWSVANCELAEGWAEPSSGERAAPRAARPSTHSCQAAPGTWLTLKCSGNAHRCAGAASPNGAEQELQGNAITRCSVAQIEQSHVQARVGTLRRAHGLQRLQQPLERRWQNRTRSHLRKLAHRGSQARQGAHKQDSQLHPA